MIFRVFQVGKHITERVNVFPEQLQRPHLVEPQIIMRGKYPQHAACDKGAGRDPQHECITIAVLLTPHYHG